MVADSIRKRPEVACTTSCIHKLRANHTTSDSKWAGLKTYSNVKEPSVNLPRTKWPVNTFSKKTHRQSPVGHPLRCKRFPVKTPHYRPAPKVCQPLSLLFFGPLCWGSLQGAVRALAGSNGAGQRLPAPRGSRREGAGRRERVPMSSPFRVSACTGQPCASAVNRRQGRLRTSAR